MSSNALLSRICSRAWFCCVSYARATVLQSCSISIWYPLSAMASSSDVQTSIAISRHTGNAAVYNAVPDFAVVDVPDKESRLSNAASVFSDNDIGARLASKLLVSNVVFNLSAISSSNCFDADVSSWLNASSPSVAWYNASASSLSMLMVNKRWLKSNSLSSAADSCWRMSSKSFARAEHAQRFSWLSLFAQNSSMQS